MSATGAPSTWRALALALALYLLWTLVTYLLEGRILTFQRPEAPGARLVYALVANVFIGIGGSALLIRLLSTSGEMSARQAGFGGLQHAGVAVVVGVALGLVIYALQGAPSFNPVVILNAYAQVLVVSIAEVLGRCREPQSVAAASAGAGEMGVRDPGCDRRKRPLRRLPLRP
jgi:hypothetical protein